MEALLVTAAELLATSDDELAGSPPQPFSNQSAEHKPMMRAVAVRLGYSHKKLLA